MKIKIDDFAIKPTRAHKTDAGLDLYSPINFTLFPGERKFIDTGVHIQLNKNTVGFIKSKSGLMRYYGIITDGTIDEGYTGPIGVVLINTSGRYIRFKRGYKIAQLVIQPVIYEELIECDELEETERGSGGFGSTGE